MKLFRKNKRGFSIIEMMFSTAAVLLLSMVSYRVLKNQTTRQIESVENQKNSKTSQVALLRFKKDVALNDLNWTRFGIPTFFPHQGYAFNSNYYIDNQAISAQTTTDLLDGITFLRRDPSSDRLYSINSAKSRFCYPQALIQAEDQNLFATTIEVDSGSGLTQGSWVLIYQAGNSILGVVSSVTSLGASASGPSNIILRAPNAYERQTTAMTTSGKSTGYVTKAGVVPASFDFDGTATGDTTDDSFCFEKNKMRLQKIASPVSYFVDYRTNDGNKKSATNSYRLDEKGSKVKMLVRAEYTGGQQVREYITPVDELAFTYDMLGENQSLSFTSAETVQVVRDVGRSSSGPQILDLSRANKAQNTNEFTSTYRIVAVKMKIGYPSKDADTNTTTTQFQETKVALDPSLYDQMYDDQTRVLSALTQNLKTNSSGSGAMNEQIGKPLYLVTGSTREVMLPVSNFEVMSDQSMGSNSTGAVYVYDDNGCAVNGSSCTPTEQSQIRFSVGTGKFFPNTISEIDAEDGSKKIVIGGATMWSGGSTTKRIPGFGIIKLNPGETLQQKLLTQDSSRNDSGTCNISDCSWQAIDNTSSTMGDLMDTAVLSIDPKNDKLYVASLTKKTGESSPGTIYKGTWTGTTYLLSRLSVISAAQEGKLVTAISDRPVTFNNNEYIAVCLSKQMSSTCEGECIKPGTQTGGKYTSDSTALVVQDETIDGHSTPTDTGVTDPLGEIQLISTTTGEATRIVKHNYKCSSINVDNVGNLVVGGRLTLQSLSAAKIKQAMSDPEYLNELSNQVMYLDEVAAVEGGTNHYADYYQVDPETYTADNGPLWVGWGTGNSTVEFSDGTFGVVYGNKYRKEVSGEVKEFSNAGISQIKLAGIDERVVATIETDPQNINNSIITATYNSQQHDIPDLFIPGKFYTNPQGSRTTPTPLPALSPTLSEQSWFQLYMSFFSSRGASGLNSNMPTLTDNYTTPSSCESSIPKTCH